MRHLILMLTVGTLAAMGCSGSDDAATTTVETTTV